MTDFTRFVDNLQSFVIQDEWRRPPQIALPLSGQLDPRFIEPILTVAEGANARFWSVDESVEDARMAFDAEALREFRGSTTVIGGILLVPGVILIAQWRADGACLVAEQDLLEEIVRNPVECAWIDFWHYAHDPAIHEWEYDEAFRYWIEAYEGQFEVDEEFYKTQAHFFQSYLGAPHASEGDPLVAEKPQRTDQFAKLIQRLCGAEMTALPLFFFRSDTPQVEAFADLFRLERALKLIGDPDLVATALEETDWTRRTVATGVKGLAGFFALAAKSSMAILTPDKGPEFRLLAIPRPADDSTAIGPAVLIGPREFVVAACGGYSPKSVIRSACRYDDPLRAMFAELWES